MRKLVAGTFVTLDGVMQAPGGPEEDRDGGFEHGGWSVKHWDEMIVKQRTLSFSKPTQPREIVREAVEENTGEKFTFKEPLEVMADFVPDLKMADASPEMRALADLCVVLFNTNEFAYVY